MFQENFEALEVLRPEVNNHAGAFLSPLQMEGREYGEESTSLERFWRRVEALARAEPVEQTENV